jgi:hypothetical protein
MKAHFLKAIMPLALLTLQAKAQNICGTVTDGRDSAIAYANVVLLSLPDSAYVDGTTSGANGFFSLKRNAENKILRISAIGYKTRIIPCRENMQTIVLQENTAELGQVTVKGHRKQYSLTDEGLQTNVEGTVLSKMGTAEDVLQHVPGVTKTSDGYEVFGKGTPLIYINGRKVQDANELKELGSANIKAVEVLRNPGASYDASAKAVIRIRTKKAQGEGFGFDTRSTFTQNKYSNTEQQINLRYYHKGLNLFGGYYYNNHKNSQNAYNAITVQGDTLWLQDGLTSYRMHGEYHKITGGFSYDLNSNHSIGARYDISFTSCGHGSGIYTNRIYADGNPYEQIVSTGALKSDSKSPTHQLNIYYNGTLGKTKIDFNTDLYFSHNRKWQSTDEESEESDSRTVNSLSEDKNRMVASKLIIGQPLWGGQLNVGAEYIHTNRYNTYEITGVPLIPNSYNQLKEQTVSPFAEYSHSLPFGNVKAGLRYEHVLFDYYLQGMHIPEQSRDFSNLFPSISVGANVGKVMMQLSYTAKTMRPSYSQLTNEISYTNRFTMQTGNPLLKHQISHCVELSGVWKFLQFSASYNNNHNAILYWMDTNEQNEAVTTINYKNQNSLKHINAYVSAAPKIGIWSPQLTIGMYKQWLTLETRSGNVRMNNPIIFSSLNNTLSFNKGWMLNASLSWQGKGDAQNTKLRADMTVLNVGITKSLLHDALTIELKGNDLLYQQYQNEILLRTPKIQLGQHAKYNTRGVDLTIRYKFNTSHNKYKGTGAGTEEINRL